MKKLFILYIGGTIGMVDKGKGLEPTPLNELKNYLPKIDNLAHLTFKSCKKLIDSTNIKPKDWIKIAKEIEKSYHNYDGFIILHGTDTLAYTASMLSFMFENLSKPIILTGSQLPLSNPRSDGVLNFINSIYIAQKEINEVIIVFGDKILRGNRSTKVSSNSFNAFDSLNYPQLGVIAKEIKIEKNLLLPKSKEKFKLNSNIETNVINIMLTPLTKPKYLKKLLFDKDIKGVVIETFGSGNIPENEKILEILKESKKMGKVIINISQTHKGMVEMGLYKSSSKLKEIGVISGVDMTLEASMTKLMWILANKDLKEYDKNLRGEQIEFIN